MNAEKLSATWLAEYEAAAHQGDEASKDSLRLLACYRALAAEAEQVKQVLDPSGSSCEATDDQPERKWEDLTALDVAKCIAHYIHVTAAGTINSLGERKRLREALEAITDLSYASPADCERMMSEAQHIARAVLGPKGASDG